MPVILRPDIEKYWLSDLPVDELKGYIESYDSNKLEFYSVSKRINSPKHNDPDLIIPESVKQQKLFWLNYQCLFVNSFISFGKPTPAVSLIVVKLEIPGTAKALGSM